MCFVPQYHVRYYCEILLAILYLEPAQVGTSYPQACSTLLPLTAGRCISKALLYNKQSLVLSRTSCLINLVNDVL